MKGMATGDDLFSNWVLSDGQDGFVSTEDFAVSDELFEQALVAVGNSFPPADMRLEVDMTGGQVEEIWEREEVEVESDERSGESGHEADVDLDEVNAWVGAVSTEAKVRTWKDLGGERLQSRCFLVEWKGSVLLDREDFLRKLFAAVGVDGADVSFVMGREVRATRADYCLVLRLKSRMRWRDWRKKLMFGHGGDVDESGLVMRVRVPCKGTDEGVIEFVEDMKRRCELYDEVCRWNEGNMVRRQSRPPTRRKRKRMVDGSNEQERQ